MDRNNDKILSGQLYSVLTGTMLGIGILSIARSLARYAGPDSLIVIFIVFIIFLLITYVLNKLVEKFPGDTIIEMGSSLICRPVGKIIGVFYLIYLITLIALGTRVIGVLVKNYLLYKTPIEVIITIFLATSVYTARSGIESIGRLAAIILPMSIIPPLITILASIPYVDIGCFLPILRTPIPQLVKAILEMIFTYIGIELILLFNPFVLDRKNIKKATYWSVITVSAVSLTSIFLTIGTFGIEETKNLLWPLVELFKTIEIPGTFIENVEIIIMSTWTLSVFLSVAVLYYGAALVASKIMDAKEFNFFTLPMLPVIYIFSLLPENIAESFDLLSIYSMYGGTMAIFVIPIILFIISFFRKTKKGMRKSA